MEWFYMGIPIPRYVDIVISSTPFHYLNFVVVMSSFGFGSNDSCLDGSSRPLPDVAGAHFVEARSASRTYNGESML
jgi:hypothetical protein